MLLRSKLLLIFAIVLLFGTRGSAQMINDNDTISDIVFYFPFDKSTLEKEYMSNSSAFERLHSLLSDTTFINTIDSIHVTSTSSPEGHEKYNIKLSKKRANALHKFLVGEDPLVNQNIVISKIIAEDWDGLRRMVENDVNAPYREKILGVLKRPASSDTKEWRLKQIGGGEAWIYIKESYLQHLRTGTTCIIHYNKEKLDKLSFKEVDPLPENEIIPAVLEEVITEENEVIPEPEEIKQEKKIEYDKKPFMAVKTNLLFDLATALNVEAEVPFGKKFSLAGEWIFPWWLWEEEQYCFQMLSGNAEFKYWLGDREKNPVMTGWFAGLYAGGGLYDFELKTRGFQGEFFIAAGVSCGYQHKIAKNLSLEYTLGVGYLKTNYRKYVPRENGEVLVWQNDGRYTWIGPTRAKVSLVWTLNRKVKRKEVANE